MIGNRPVQLGLLIILLVVSCRQRQPDRASIYTAVSERLEEIIEYEIETKDLNSISIVLVDQEKIIWDRAFGFQDLGKTQQATSETVYRVGSVSKLFTDIAIMQLVERGEIELDTPIKSLLPGFSLANNFDHPITLRMLMSHRSGILREPRVGNYFDAHNDNLAETVKSINGSELIYEPGSKTKYSNAGIAIAGYVLEYLSNTPYTEYMQQHILEPIGMINSAFKPNPSLQNNLAEASMWSYDLRTFPAPEFQLGMIPAGSLYAPMQDLGLFLITLFRQGHTSNGNLIEPETLSAMWSPQFEGDPMDGYGIGFRLGEFNGYQKIGHGGAIYGFSTQLSAVPDLKIGVACASSVDLTNSVVRRISDYALELLHAAKTNASFPEYETTHPIPKEKQQMLTGYYQHGEQAFELVRKMGDLVWVSNRFECVLRQGSEGLVSDGRNNFGAIRLIENEDALMFDGKRFAKISPPVKSEYPRDWDNLIGEYGDDHIILYIYEKEGNLHALIEWFEKDKLTQLSKNEFAFPATGGMYHGETMAFERDEKGLAQSVSIKNGPVFHRRDLGAVTEETFKIEPIKPVAELNQLALAASPPPENGDFKTFDLIDIRKLDTSILYDIRYASDNNFMGTSFYTLSRAYLQRPAAEALVRVHQGLKKHGFGLLIHDAYRPWYVTKMFWDATPEDKKIFVADPSKGSRHNRGAAVDLTLYDLITRKAVTMVAGYDEMTDRSFAFYHGGNTQQRYLRDLLRRSMEAEGFMVYEYEWWHFDFEDWRSYPIGNTRFEDL